MSDEKKEAQQQTYVTRAELDALRVELRDMISREMKNVVGLFQGKSSPEIAAALRNVVDSLKAVIFAPPDEIDLVPEDAFCGCGHTRLDHCGCGAHCLPPANDIERAKANRGDEFIFEECKCGGFVPKEGGDGAA
jgi:hypothetical protein